MPDFLSGAVAYFRDLIKEERDTMESVTKKHLVLNSNSSACSKVGEC